MEFPRLLIRYKNCRGESWCNEYNFRARVEGLFEEYAWGRLCIPRPHYEYRVTGFVARHYGRIVADLR